MTIENSPQISIEQVAELSSKIIQEVEKAVVGKREVLQLMMAAFLSSAVISC
jgi:MoxR-like ATPase